MAKIGKVFLEFEAGTAKFNEPIKRAGRNLQGFGKQAGISGKIVGSLKSSLTGLIGPMALLGTATAGLFSTLNNLRALEKLDARLKTATGSAIGAKEALSEMRQLSSTMPNSVEELTGSFIKLKNFGLDASKGSLISYANTAAALGKSLDQLIEAVADASTREFERLKEFGIITKNQGDTIAFTFRGVTTEVRNSSREIQDYLIALGDTAFAGSIAEQMDTIDGKLSNLSDAWFNFTTSAGSGLPQAIKATLGLLTDGLNGITNGSLQADFVKKIEKEGIGSATAADLPQLEQYLRTTKDILKGSLAGNEANRERGKQIVAAVSARRTELLIQKRAQEEEKQATELARKVEEGKAAFQEHARQSNLRALPVKEKLVALAKEEMAIIGNLNSGEFSKASSETKRLAEIEKDRTRLLQDSIRKSEEQARAIDKMTESARRFNTSFAEGMARGIVLGDSLGDVLSNIVQQLAVDGLARLIGGFIGGKGGAGGIGGFVSGIFDGARASGGPVTGGRSYLVGEKGPELFTPGASGGITPNGALGGMVVNNKFDINGSGMDLQRMISRTVETSVRMAIAENQNLKNRGALA